MTALHASGVSFVVPVRNGAPWIREVVSAVWKQHDGRPMEVIAVDDGSEDGSGEILAGLARMGRVRLVPGERRGAAAAVNTGVRAARFPIVCQVDQDVILGPGWMTALLGSMSDPGVAAVQGYYASDRHESLCSRIMALDLEQRYGALVSDRTDHVCTGNSAYRRDALIEVGLFDESLGYGYDNDMSYRLRARGYELLICREARSTHRWRQGLAAYCMQQYGFGYGRLDLVAKHPHRIAGDAVSPAPMMLHPVTAGCAVVAALLAATLAVADGPWAVPALVAALLFGLLILERAFAGVRAYRTFGDPAAFLFPVLHLVRDFVWIAAGFTWLCRRTLGRRVHPSHSMRPRPSTSGSVARGPMVGPRIEPSARILALIPAHNEASNLPSVVRELRTCCPTVDVLVVDDGSTDETSELLCRLGCQWLRFPERMGIGSAVRAGLRYASRMGYGVAVRLDGDGQHCAGDIEQLIGPLRLGDADVVLGSRYIAGEGPGGDRSWRRQRGGSERLPVRLLAGCLSALTGKQVTDPTSGFCAFGPRAIRVLAEHHPTGYPEPELRLFLSRNRLRVSEVAVLARPRLAGRTSLTPVRMVGAGARVLLALVIEPLRAAVRTPP